MESIPKLIFGFQIAIWGGALLIIIFLIIRRMKAKEQEDFDKRDN